MVLEDKTPSLLLDILVDEVERIFRGVTFMVTDENGQIAEREMTVFKQRPPVRYTQSADELPYPNVEVKLIQGEPDKSKENSGRKLYHILMVFGIKDYGEEAWKAPLSMYERVMMRFTRNPRLGSFEETGEGMFENQADDTWPYYFLACTLNFLSPRLVREDVDGLC